MNKKTFLIIIIGFFTNGCFGALQTNPVIYTDPHTGLQTQSWLYSPSPSEENTKKKLTQQILKSSLYISCLDKGGIPKATYSQPILSSLILSCNPK